MQLVALRCSNTNTDFVKYFLWHFAVSMPRGRGIIYQESSVGRARSTSNFSSSSKGHQSNVWSRSSCESQPGRVLREGGFQEAAKKRGSLQPSPPCHGSSPSWPQCVQCPGIATGWERGRHPTPAPWPPHTSAWLHPAFHSLSSPGRICSLQLTAKELRIPSVTRWNLVTAPSSPRAGHVGRDKTSQSLLSLVQINVSSSDQPPCTSTQPAGENQTSKGRKRPEQDIAINRSSGDGDEMEN